jgi:uncharacterized protein YkwD
MANTVNVRTTAQARAFAQNILARINKERKKAKKEPLSQSQVIALAIENLTVQMGVEK